MTTIKRPIKRRLFTSAKRLLAAVGLYALLGFLLLPYVARYGVNYLLAEKATVPASLARIQFNPFTLELSLHGLRVGASDTETVAFERLYANLQVDSLWSGAVHFSRVALDNATSELHFSKKGEFNLAGLFVPTDKPAGAGATESSTGIFPLRVDQVDITFRRLQLQDLRNADPVAIVVEPVTLALTHLSTLPDETTDLTMAVGQPSAGDAVAEPKPALQNKAGRVQLTGQFSVAERTAMGHFSLDGSHLTLFWPYVRTFVPLALPQGVVASLATDFRLEAAGPLQVKLDNANITLRSLDVQSPEGQNLLTLKQLALNKVSLDLRKQKIVVGSIVSDGIHAWAARREDGQLDWQALLAPSDNATPASPKKPATAWQVSLPDARLSDAYLHLTDRAASTPVNLELGPLALEMRDFDTRNQAPFSLKLETGIGKLGHLSADGQIQLGATTHASLHLVSKDIDLRLAQAYLSPFVRLELRSGQLDSDLQINLDTLEPLTFLISGAVTINQLHALDTLKNQDLLKWEQLQLDGLRYQRGEPSQNGELAIGNVALQQPYARFIINENRSTNVSDLVIASAANGTPTQPLSIHIGAVHISDGSANFADYSLTPNFATAIQQLNGQIGVLDNRQSDAATVDITGKVDRYAPVSIRGTLTPFDPLQRLDIEMHFERVELTTLTPYSGKFAGYRIRKGRLNLDLHYRIHDKHLDAENKVVLEELQLGEKVDSPDAVDLPVRLAVALLKDAKGNIRLELPISGDLDNPTFEVGPVIWKTLRNLLMRAVKSPFSFIAGLVKSDTNQNLDNVSFRAGSSELDGAAKTKLMTLAAALKARPQLHLEIEGVSARQADSAPLAEQQLQNEYRKAYYRVLQNSGEKVKSDYQTLMVPDKEKPALLEIIYQSRLKHASPDEWRKLEDAQRQAKLHDALLTALGDSERGLRQLARDRATAIKAQLVESGGVDDARIYLLNARLMEVQGTSPPVTALYLDVEGGE